MGCSAGGTQGMQEAQKFPWDFDGIIAGAPALSWAALDIGLLWNHRALTGPDGRALLNQAELDLLHHALVNQCDRNDGIEDGLIGDPRACNFDPAALRCTKGLQSQCLTDTQIDVIRKIYRGPVTTQGVPIVRPAALKGSERTWLTWFRGPKDAAAADEAIAESFRYWHFWPDAGPLWKPKNFDFDRDFKRMGLMGSLEPVNPDLRRFKAAGGKLLLYTGWADAAEGVLNTIDYYETAERLMGGRAATQDFFRLFVIPGMHHCGGGEGPWAVDYLSYLEAWAERGQAPDVMIGHHPKEARNGEVRFPIKAKDVKFTRPVYPYPYESTIQRDERRQ